MTVAISRALSVLVSLLMAVSLLLIGLGRADSGLLVQGVATDDPYFPVVLAAYVLTTGALAWVGAILSARVAWNPIGRILTGLGVWTSFAFFTAVILAAIAPVGREGDDLRDLSGWLGAWTYVPMVTISSGVILILFPTGRLLFPSWRVFLWLTALGTTSWSVAEASRAVLGLTDRINPYQSLRLEVLGDWVSLVLAPCLIAAGANIVLRFRRAKGDERLQLKWITFAGIVTLITWGFVWILSDVAQASFGGREVAAATISIALLFGAISTAILKYRLYAIDRLISRSVTYGLAAGVLALVYATVAIALPQLIGRGQQSSLTTAAATLAVAGLFRPLTSRLHRAVDRRFNRVRFDAQREVEGFTADLGRRVDLDGVVSTLSTVVSRTVAPNAIGVWIRSQP